MNKRFILLSLIIVSLAGCAQKTTPPPAGQADQLPVQTPAGGDYFPVKAELRHATAFDVEYHDTYKIVRNLRPWRDASTTFTYILVQRDTTPPEHSDAAQVIEIPVRSIASLSATHLPYLDEIQVLDTLVGIGNAEHVSNAAVRQGLEEGRITPAGNGPDINMEALLNLNPEVVTTLALGNSNKDDYQQLLKKGLNAVIVSDFMEETPLGRAEWVKFVALFYNQEAAAERVFSGIEERYEKMRSLAAAATGQPTVIMGFEINGTWNMPGGNSYQAAYIEDAGGKYLWQDDESTGRIPLSFEAALERGTGADFWFNQSVAWKTAADVLSADPRYANFAAFNAGHTYNNNARLNATGGNEFNESGHANPDVILEDLISILHPGVLPDHTLVYYRPLKP